MELCYLTVSELVDSSAPTLDTAYASYIYDFGQSPISHVY